MGLCSRRVPLPALPYQQHNFAWGNNILITWQGGNTDTIYNTDDNRLEFAESLQKQHPDVVKVTRKFNRWHHHVNYKPFKKNKLIKKQGLIIPERINEYGMVLKTL